MGRFREIVGQPRKYEKIAPGDTATGISASNLVDDNNLPAIAAFITVESNTVTVAFNGSTPTNAAGTNLGHQLAAGDSLFLRGIEAVKNFKCVDTVSGSAGTVKVTVYF